MTERPERVDWEPLEDAVWQVLNDLRAAGRVAFKASQLEGRLIPAGETWCGHPRRVEWGHYPDVEPRRVLQVLDRLEARGAIKRARTRSGRPTKKRDYVFPKPVPVPRSLADGLEA